MEMSDVGGVEVDIPGKLAQLLSPRAVQNGLPQSDRPEDCVHQPSHTRYSITALCQGCHCNRVLQVAM